MKIFQSSNMATATRIVENSYHWNIIEFVWATNSLSPTINSVMISLIHFHLSRILVLELKKEKKNPKKILSTSSSSYHIFEPKSLRNCISTIFFSLEYFWLTFLFFSVHYLSVFIFRNSHHHRNRPQQLASTRKKDVNFFLLEKQSVFCKILKRILFIHSCKEYYYHHFYSQKNLIEKSKMMNKNYEEVKAHLNTSNQE